MTGGTHTDTDTSAGLALRRLRGFTLVEMMVGLAVGMFVALAAISIFISTRTLQTVSFAGTRMGENSRLAMELLHKDLRSAGFLGCKSLISDPPISLLAANDRFLDTATDMAGIRASRGNGGGFTPALNATLAALAPNADSDFISIRVPIEPLSLGLSVPMTSSSGVAPQVGVATPGNTIQSGAVLLIANCKASALFQVTEANPAATGSLSHAVGSGFNPGNVSDDFQQVFRGDSAVYRLQTNHYYIAPGSHAGTNSMWRLAFPNPTDPTTAPVPEEVVQGIDRMVLSYGLDKGDQTVNRYVTADGVGAAWGGVVAVRIQLLSTTVKDGVTLTPQAASFAGGTVPSSDHRLRSQVTEVVTLRSHAP